MSSSEKRRKTVLVTGCTPGGIGHALATEFQARGFHVIATARRSEALDSLRSAGMSAVELEMTDEASIASCRKEVGKLVDGKLDILINNAGRSLTIPATDVTLASARAVFETNLISVMAMVSSHIDLLIPAHGLIINVSSISAVIPYIFGSVYASSKAALSSYSRTLRAELRPFGVGVMVVMAGTVKSNIGNVPNLLPENSLYAPVKHLYEARLGYSQQESSNPLPTEVFAKRLVNDALKPEVGMVWRSLGFGRPDWLWYGGESTVVYWGSWLPEWVFDWLVSKRFGLWELEGIEERKRSGDGVEKKTI
ncbi:MAG: hypothetical protein Q9216_002069 [Gyalolechia sp. 2 TL-2023]